MTLTPYQPLGLLHQLQRELAGGEEHRDDASIIATSWIPAVDIREDQDHFLIRADLPGVDPKDIEVSMENGMLTIRGERNESKEENKGEWHRVERVSGQFYRRFSLPDTADADSIKAKSNHGVLEIEIPKQARAKPRKISVELS